MATNSRFGGKQRPGKTPAPEIEVKLSDLLAEEAKAEAAQEPASETPEIIDLAAEVAPQPEPTPEPEPFAFDTRALAKVEPATDSKGQQGQKSAAGGWPFTAFDMWTENANALLDFTEELGKAKSICDVIALQSKFASERYEAFVKHTNEFAEATRRFAAQAGVTLPQGFVAVFTA